MPFRTLKAFVDFLESKNDLCRIKTEVDPHLEITEIASRVGAQKGPALLFENVKGSKFPLLVNPMGTEKRVEWALGKSPAEIGKILGGLAHDIFPPSPAKLWKNKSAIFRGLAMKPKKRSSAPFLKNKIEPGNLDKLPVSQSWPKDGGPFLTFPLVITKSPVDGKQNVGLYRMQKFSQNQTGMHWQIGKGGGYHYQQAEAKNQNLPLHVALGVDPISMLCGVLPLPEGMDEIAFAGFFRGESTSVYNFKESNVSVPAEADFILEGYVPPTERRIEGPYGDHFGHYSHAAPFPVFHIDRIWHRDDAIFPISVVGKPPQEDQVLGDAVQEMMMPLLKAMHPEIVDIWAYQEAGFHNLLVISVKQRFQKEAIKTALWAFGEGQLSLSKCIILVDPDTNARDFSAVLKSIRENFDPKKDFILLPSTSQDTLDFTSFKMNLGSKMIIDATKSADNPMKVSMQINLDRIKEVDSKILDLRLVNKSLLVLQVESNGRDILEKLLEFPDIASIPMVATVSKDVPLDNETLLIWGIFTRFDCERDTFFGSVELKGGHPVYSGPLLIDATWKNGYPEPLEMTPEVIKKVNDKWDSYGIDMKPKPPSPNLPGHIKEESKELSHSN